MGLRSTHLGQIRQQQQEATTAAEREMHLDVSIVAAIFGHSLGQSRPRPTHHGGNLSPSPATLWTPRPICTPGRAGVLSESGSRGPF